MFDLAPFALSDMIAASAALREAHRDATCMEEVAGAIVGYLHEHLIDKASGRAASVLVRMYKIHPYDQLPSDLQTAARESTARQPASLSGVNCLVLLASAGVEPAWCDRRASAHHQAIPLATPEAVERLPMVASLLAQLRVDPELVTAVPIDLVGGHLVDNRSFDVFHVADAAGSRSIPDQDDFVVPYGIRSVVGFGGVLPSASMFAVILFSTVAIPRPTAELFASLALAAKVAILPFDGGRIFADEPLSRATIPTTVSLESQAAALRDLLQVRETMVSTQTVTLETALATLEERSEQLSDSLAALALSQAGHQALIDASIDAVLSMDDKGRVLAFNPAAERIFGYQRAAAIGQPLDELIIPPAQRADHRRGLDRYLREGIGPILGRHLEMTALRADGTEFPIELTVNAVSLPGLAPSFTATVRDITSLKATQQRLSEARRHSARIARTLQESLLPPQLPRVPGIDVGSIYHPAGDGSEIGGDFYDVFQTGKDDWVVVLGDVCGKGAAAAAVTALARYTLRAAAMRIRRPSAVLGVLNQALLAQQTDRFCTLVYLRLRLRSRLVRVTIASGGHPLPLLARPDGSVRSVGRPGMLVGVFPEATWVDQTIDLLPDDTLVAYTDGVTEARGEEGFFGEARLRQLVASLANAPAARIAAEIQAAVMAYQGDIASDDLAVLALHYPAVGLADGLHSLDVG